MSVPRLGELISPQAPPAVTSHSLNGNMSGQQKFHVEAPPRLKRTLFPRSLIFNEMIQDVFFVAFHASLCCSNTSVFVGDFLLLSYRLFTLLASQISPRKLASRILCSRLHWISRPDCIYWVLSASSCKCFFLVKYLRTLDERRAWFKDLTFVF